MAERNDKFMDEGTEEFSCVRSSYGVPVKKLDQRGVIRAKGEALLDSVTGAVGGIIRSRKTRVLAVLGLLGAGGGRMVSLVALIPARKKFPVILPCKELRKW